MEIYITLGDNNNNNNNKEKKIFSLSRLFPYDIPFFSIQRKRSPFISRDRNKNFIINFYVLYI